jgi:Protein of unknown function (DUF2853)
MSKLAELVTLYQGENKELGLGLDNALVEAVAKGLGPSIYNTDSSRVSCTDQTEMDRVKTNFLIGKLGLADGPALDAAIKEVCDAMGSSNRNKYRTLFYALLVKKFGKESVYMK